jgi:pimeloyl-ACP methyl ester carboxylesterase
MNRLLAALLMLGLCLAGPAATAPPPPKQDLMARLPDGRKLHFACAGRGAPTVILESGWGATAEAWFKVQPELARQTRVCSYDRAGYGRSDEAPPPRDAAAIAADLDHGLRAARIGGPLILVGHSAGALYVQAFALLRPADVVGMVLVDPSVAYQDQRFADFGPGAASVAPLRTRAARCAAFLEGALSLTDEAERDRCTNGAPHGPGTAPPAAFWRTEVAELDTLWGLSSAETPTGAGTLGDLPLVVLTAGGKAAADEGSPQGLFQTRWRYLHRELAARSTRGVERAVAGASHLIMIDRPDAVIAAVREVIAESRRPPSPGRS